MQQIRRHTCFVWHFNVNRCIGCKFMYVFFIVSPIAKSCVLPPTNPTTNTCYNDPTFQMYTGSTLIAGALSGRLQSILEADEQTESAVEVIRQMTEALLWGEQNVSCHGI